MACGVLVVVVVTVSCDTAHRRQRLTLCIVLPPRRPTFAYFRLGLLIEGVGRRRPASPKQLLAALDDERPSTKELVFLRRLCRARDAGALLTVVCSWRPAPTPVFVGNGALFLPTVLEEELDDDVAHNIRVAAHAAALAEQWQIVTTRGTTRL